MRQSCVWKVAWLAEVVKLEGPRSWSVGLSERYCLVSSAIGETFTKAILMDQCESNKQPFMRRCPILSTEKHVDFDAVEGTEVYNVTDLSIRSDYHEGGYPTMMDEYRQYNALKKWFNRNCGIALDCPVRHINLKNILKVCFKEYLDWDDDMVVPNVPDSYSDSDAIFIRNPREVHSCGRPQINRSRSSYQNAFRGDVRRWGSRYYMYMKRDKASKVGVAVANGVVEEVEEVVCGVVEEVEAMMQM
ncbi:hypothetical protein T459_24920 [Capsicum annuum]|uniref:Uncharacterized protein n=1 Tax=Capsicum annuum TaxID=4072 RepID=A0A2G2YJ89_CAPAN|nr:hypothetical protein T459_24920 [Capsicum annuum]